MGCLPRTALSKAGLALALLLWAFLGPCQRQVSSFVTEKERRHVPLESDTGESAASQPLP